MASGKKGKKLAAMSMIPTYPLFKLAEVYGMGAEKYAPFNWAQGGIPFSSLYDALIRHAAQWNGGEEIDPENGQDHLASVAWMAFALLELGRTHPEDDDRKHVVLGEKPLSIASKLTNPEIFEKDSNPEIFEKTDTEVLDLRDPATEKKFLRLLKETGKPIELETSKDFAPTINETQLIA